MPLPTFTAAPAYPCVFVVADPEHVVELVAALSEPLPTTVVSKIDVVASSGGDDTVDLAEERRPYVIVVTASLETGDTAALVEALRSMIGRREELGIVLIGDDPKTGHIKSAADAVELAPDRFVTRPLAPRALRFAVASVVEAVVAIRGPGAGARGTNPGFRPSATHAGVPDPRDTRTNGHGNGDTTTARTTPPWPPAPSFIEDKPEVGDEPTDAIPAVSRTFTPMPTPVRAAPPPPPGRADPAKSSLRARWEALADSIVDLERTGADYIEERDELDVAMDESTAHDSQPMPSPILIRPRQRTQSEHPTTQVGDDEVHDLPPERPSWHEPAAPAREPTLIINDEAPQEPRTRTGDDKVIVAERAQHDEQWSEPMPLAELVDRERDSKRELAGPSYRGDVSEDIALDDFDDEELLEDDDADADRNRQPARLEVLAMDDQVTPPPLVDPAPPVLSDGRDFARQLRAKMSQMAQRLFQGGTGSAPASGPVDLGPRHDHHTEIDLASLGEETPLGERGVTEFEARAPSRPGDARDLATSPGSWDTQVRERGLPDTGEIVRGVSDAALLVAKMFAGGATGRIQFRRGAAPDPVVEKVVFFDQGRPVFAASSERRDRMGELLVREGKITAAQYERCQSVVAESGRRMGEILVDFGYMKRRELLPAVRRHVEDIVYSLFGWDRGHYHITLDDQPSAERIRLSRHPAALVLEGIRRKLDRTSLERLVGPPSTVIEIGDRERLGGIINMGDLAAEERAAIAAFDGHADLLSVARVAGVDVADVLPIAWGLVVLGLAVARRTETEVPDESTALVGETDLAIDRERVRARWQLVTDADYFALLGVRRDATGFEIRRAYQSARRDFATDAFPTDLRRELAQELDDIANVLDEAFRVLRDDRLRQTYLANLVE